MLFSHKQNNGQIVGAKKKKSAPAKSPCIANDGSPELLSPQKMFSPSWPLSRKKPDINDTPKYYFQITVLEQTTPQIKEKPRAKESGSNIANQQL